MPTKKVSALPAASAASGTELVPVVQGGVSSKMTALQLATYIIALVTNSAPSTLDTLNELAAALGNDPNFATTVSTALGLKAPLANPAFTGNPTAPTPAPGDNDTSIATSAFVVSALGTALALYATLASPALTGNPTAPTPAAGDNDTSIATTAFVENRAMQGILLNLADNGTQLLGPSGMCGPLIVVRTDGPCQVCRLQSNWNAVANMVLMDNFLAFAKDTAASINVYYDAAGGGGAGYYIQNKTGQARKLHLIFFGSPVLNL